MKQDGIIFLILIGCCLGVYGIIFYYVWKANKEKAHRVDAEIKFNEGKIDNEIDSMSVSDLVKRANKRDRERKS